MFSRYQELLAFFYKRLSRTPKTINLIKILQYQINVNVVLGCLDDMRVGITDLVNFNDETGIEVVQVGFVAFHYLDDGSIERVARLIDPPLQHRYRTSVYSLVDLFFSEALFVQQCVGSGLRITLPLEKRCNTVSGVVGIN
ncbi:hypothetical protein D3C84_676850 [compost metagenome]